MSEIWIDVYGEGGYYQVSNLGGVKSLNRTISYTRAGELRTRVARGVMLIGQPNSMGYLRVSMTGSKKHFIHRLVAQHFIPNPLNLPQVNHKNGNILDNRADNLEWCTQSQNTQHAVDTGLLVALRGEESGKAKLKEIDVKIIREALALGHKIRVIAEYYKVERHCIWYIKANKHWQHV